MDYPGKVITKNQVTPTQTSASGVWTLDDAASAVKNNNWPVAGVPNPINKSLRFNSADTAYLNRTFSTPTSRNIWTWSGWIKRSALGNTAGYRFFEGGDGTSANSGFIGFGDGTGVECIRFYNRLSSTTNIDILTTAVFRDVSAWYHVVVAYDSAQVTQANKLLMYVNGVNYTWSGTAPSGSQTSAINTSAYIHNIGVSPWNTSTYFDGYMTEVNFIDGQALTPSSFGMTNPQTGQWIPLKYSGTYGANGFYLNFKDATSTTTLGYDYSGNANNWAVNGISVTAGSGNDSLTDVPTPWIAYNTTGDVGGVVRGNYATLSSIFSSTTATTISNGGLDVSFSTGSYWARSSFAIPSTGKWYFEFIATAISGDARSPGVGVALNSSPNNPGVDTGTSSVAWTLALQSGNKRYASAQSYGSGFTANTTVGCCAIDRGTNSIWWGTVSGGTITWFASGDPVAGTNAAFTNLTTGDISPVATCDVGATNAVAFNFGQRPFAASAAPAGFLSLCTTNLPTPTIGATSTTQANDYFDVLLETGTGSARNVTGLQFAPDFLWAKGRNASSSHLLYDTVRGVDKSLNTNNTLAEDTAAGQLTSFNSNGYSLPNDTAGYLNLSGRTYAFWNWNAGGSNQTISVNQYGSTPSIASTVRANTTAGFSIVTYTGTGANATVGHGLGVVPSMIIFRNRSPGDDWATYHVSIGNTGAVFLNLTNATQTFSTYFQDTSPSSTLITLGSQNRVNSNGNGMVAYCFAAVAGYSAFGSYTGNGSSDGPFVYLGFRPRWVMVKSSTESNNWWLYDTARDPYNAMNNLLRPDLPNLDVTQGYSDFLSNGFKVRNTGQNNSGQTYIYAAFAESPFKYALAR